MTRRRGHQTGLLDRDVRVHFRPLRRNRYEGEDGIAVKSQVSGNQVETYHTHFHEANYAVGGPRSRRCHEFLDTPYRNVTCIGNIRTVTGSLKGEMW